jgi:molybdenum cofactor guanylyltransferase
VEGGRNPLGVVLAGGAGERLGGSKAMVDLAGRPLISYPLAAFADAGMDAVVVAKAETAVPALDLPVLEEPAVPQHPLLGVVTALEHAEGRAIVTSPCDTPFVTAALLLELARSGGNAAVHDGERLHPLLARYEPSALPVLRQHLSAGRSATAACESLNPRRVTAERELAFNVNTEADLAAARARLR